MRGGKGEGLKAKTKTTKDEKPTEDKLKEPGSARSLRTRSKSPGAAETPRVAAAAPATAEEPTAVPVAASQDAPAAVVDPANPAASPPTKPMSTDPSAVLSDQEIAWRLHQELNAANLLRTRSRRPDSKPEKGDAKPAEGKDGGAVKKEKPGTTDKEEPAPATKKGPGKGNRKPAADDSKPRDDKSEKAAAKHQDDVKPAKASAKQQQATTTGGDDSSSGAAAGTSESDDKPKSSSPKEGDEDAKEESKPRKRKGRPEQSTGAPSTNKPASTRPAKAIKIPKLPMVLHNKKWYRARLLKDNGEKVLLEFAGFEHILPSTWLPRASDRIWLGSYKGKDWKYLGDGAWEPKAGIKSGHPSSAHGGSNSSGRGRKPATAKPNSQRDATTSAHESQDDDDQLVTGKHGKDKEQQASGRGRKRGSTDDPAAPLVKKTRRTATITTAADVATNATIGKGRRLDPIVREAMLKGDEEDGDGSDVDDEEEEDAFEEAPKRHRKEQDTETDARYPGRQGRRPSARRGAETGGQQQQDDPRFNGRRKAARNALKQYGAWSESEAEDSDSQDERRRQQRRPRRAAKRAAIFADDDYAFEQDPNAAAAAANGMDVDAGYYDNYPAGLHPNGSLSREDPAAAGNGQPARRRRKPLVASPAPTDVPGLMGLKPLTVRAPASTQRPASDAEFEAMAALAEMSPRALKEQQHAKQVAARQAAMALDEDYKPHHYHQQQHQRGGGRKLVGNGVVKSYSHGDRQPHHHRHRQHHHNGSFYHHHSNGGSTRHHHTEPHRPSLSRTKSLEGLVTAQQMFGRILGALGKATGDDRELPTYEPSMRMGRNDSDALLAKLMTTKSWPNGKHAGILSASAELFSMGSIKGASCPVPLFVAAAPGI